MKRSTITTAKHNKRSHCQQVSWLLDELMCWFGMVCIVTVHWSQSRSRIPGMLVGLSLRVLQRDWQVQRRLLLKVPRVPLVPVLLVVLPRVPRVLRRLRRVHQTRFQLPVVLGVLDAHSSSTLETLVETQLFDLYLCTTNSALLSHRKKINNRSCSSKQDGTLTKIINDNDNGVVHIEKSFEGS